MSTVVARIGKPHGLRGEVTVQVHTDNPEDRFVIGAEFGTEPARGPLTVAGTRVHQGIWLLRFEQAGDRTAAEQLRGTRLVLVDEEDAGEEDAWYEEDLVGLEVRDPAGVTLGEVIALHVRPAQDLIEVRLRDGRSGLVPFVEQIVPSVQAQGEDPHVVVDAPPGLFDLDS